ncbi:MAG: pirin family protein [Aggregatilineales bacterium]
MAFPLQMTAVEPGFVSESAFQYYPADTFPTIHPVHWLNSHFAVGGWSPLQRLSGMLTAHMTRIAPRNGFTWHPHRALEIYTWVLEGELYHEDTTGGKGIIHAGELQRMFAGDYIEHQELNISDNPARVIQIWYVADRHHRGIEPHYQQVGRSELPRKRIGDATVFGLIGEGSPMQQHMTGRLTATTIDAGGLTTVENPREDEDLFLYVTDGTGKAVNADADARGHVASLGQYDVILAQHDADTTTISAGDDNPLHYMSFYLPKFIGA